MTTPTTALSAMAGVGCLAGEWCVWCRRYWLGGLPPTRCSRCSARRPRKFIARAVVHMLFVALCWRWSMATSCAVLCSRLSTKVATVAATIEKKEVYSRMIEMFIKCNVQNYLGVV